MKVLFEDTITKFPYPLLTEASTIEIIGSDGNKNLTKCMREINSDMLVIVDTVADNPVTVGIYNRAVKLASKLDNTYVLPFPCIEYAFIRAFIGYTTDESTAAIMFKDYTKFMLNHRGMQLVVDEGYETFCKSIALQHKDCYGNGVFILQDCLCDVPTDCCASSKQDKGITLMCCLPVFLNKFNIDSIEEVLHTCENLYYTMGNRFVSAGIIKTVPKLLQQKIKTINRV